MSEKRCGSCKETKDTTEFTKHSRTLDGLNYACRVCTCASRAASRIKNIERERVYDKANRDQINAKRRVRRLKGDVRERELAGNRAAYHANKEVWAARHRQWSQANKEATRLHASNRRARIANATTVPFTAGQLAERWAYYGNKCYLCPALAEATDHVKPLNKGGAHMLCNLRPICTPCNSRKRDKWPYALVAA